MKSLIKKANNAAVKPKYFGIDIMEQLTEAMNMRVN